MKLAKAAIAMFVMCSGSQAVAENWVTVVPARDTALGVSEVAVDKDSIRRGSDNLIYFNSKLGSGLEDEAVDCQKRIRYFLKLYGVDRPNWRAEGSPVEPGYDPEVSYVCANIT